MKTLFWGALVRGLWSKWFRVAVLPRNGCVPLKFQGMNKHLVPSFEGKISPLLSYDLAASLTSKVLEQIGDG